MTHTAPRTEIDWDRVLVWTLLIILSLLFWAGIGYLIVWAATP